MEKENRDRGISEIALENILDMADIRIFWKDQNRRYIGATRAYAEYLGYNSPDEIVGKTANEIQWRTRIEEYDQKEEEIVQGKRSSFRMQVQCMVRGGMRDIVVNVHVTMMEGRIAGLVGIIDDMTEELEQKEEIQRLQSVKADFLTRISHDLITPLTAITGLSELGMHGNQDARDMVYFTKIRDTADYMLKLVNRLLDFQALHEGNVRLEPSAYSLSALIDRIETLIRPTAQRKAIRFSIRRDNAVYGMYVKQDIARTEQILVNVLSNAVKYTALGGVVTWKIAVEESSAGDMIIIHHTIEDNGEGISPDDIGHIFEPFSQDRKRMSRYESGAGFGLAVTKRTLDLMGGSIECESEVGKGSIFRISIPQAMPTAEEKEKLIREDRDTASEESFLEGKRILVANDNKLDAEIIMRMLKDAGADAEYAPNGAVALQRAESGEIDLILMDLRMPVVNGIESAQRIRSMQIGVPIIGMTDRPRSSDPRRALEVGMNNCIEMPPERETLLNNIRELLNLEGK